MRSLLVTVLMVAAVSCRGGDSTGSRGGEAKTPRPEMSPAEEVSTAEQWESVASLFVRDGSLLWDGVYVGAVADVETVEYGGARRGGTYVTLVVDERVAVSESAVRVLDAGEVITVVVYPPPNEGICQGLGSAAPVGSKVVFFPSFQRGEHGSAADGTAVPPGYLNSRLLCIRGDLVQISDHSEGGGIYEIATIPIRTLRSIWGGRLRADPDAAGSIQRRCAALACGKTGTCFLGAGCTQVAVAKPEAVGALRVDGTYVVAEDYPTVEGVDGGR